MFEIAIKSDFSSAHDLRGYKGKCEALHGHNWEVEVKVAAVKLDKIGMAMDFHILKRRVNEITSKLDHKYLNDIPYFSAAGGSASGGKKINPTSENIAKFIFDNLKKKLNSKNIKVKAVTVWESKTSSATYFE